MRLLFVTCCIMLLAFSCRKKENEIVESINATGCFFTGSAVVFWPQFKDPSTHPTINKIEWNFGDNSANAYTHDIAHVYQKAGTYTVTLILNKDKLTKTIEIGNALSSPHTALLASERKWRGTGKGHIIEFNGSDYISDTAIDTKLTIKVLDDRNIQLLFANIAPVLTLTAIDESTTTLKFKECSDRLKTLTYNYTTKEIIYSSYWQYGKRYGKLDLYTVN